MAKRKDSVALFEVITATRKREEAAATGRSSLRTPKWWFNSKNKGAGAAASAASSSATPASEDHAFDSPAPQIAATPLSPQLAAPIDPTIVATPTPTAAVVQRVAPVEYASPAPERVNIPTDRTDAAASTADPFGLEVPSSQLASSTSSRRRSWLGFGAKRVGLDRSRHEVTVRLRYTTAIIVGFACCVAVGLAYVTGRSTNRASADPNAVTTENIRKGPVLPGVLEVSPDGSTTTVTPDQTDSPDNRGGSDDVIGTGGGPTVSRGKTGAGTTTTGGNAVRPVTPPGDVEDNAQRTIGLNYVIAQSYRTEKEALAAQTTLTKAGIPCTIERGLKGWENVISVVGIKGFHRTSSAEYQNYVRAIENAGSRTKPFDPMGYRWR